MGVCEARNKKQGTDHGLYAVYTVYTQSKGSKKRGRIYLFSQMQLLRQRAPVDRLLMRLVSVRKVLVGRYYLHYSVTPFTISRLGIIN